MTADEFEGFVGFDSFFSGGFRDGILVHFNGNIVDGQDRFNDLKDIIFVLFVLTKEQAHDLLSRCRGFCHGLVSSRFVEVVVALLAGDCTQRVVVFAIRTSNADDAFVLFLATKHALTRHLGGGLCV